VHFKRKLISLWVVCLTLWTGAPKALADGGTIRFSGRRGDRMIWIFTTPTPLRAGRTDLSVLVQDVESGRAIANLSIEVSAHHSDQPEARIFAPATNEAATNKLMQAALFEFAMPGRWHVDVFVDGMDRNRPIAFDLDVAGATVPWLQTVLWIAWPIVPIGLFAIHEFRVRPNSFLSQNVVRRQSEKRA
jgi:hypothetical protein